MLPLVFIDVDGTLVGSSGEPSADTWQAAAEAVARGQHLALATARPALGPTFDWARRIDPDSWHVFQSGTALVNTGSGEIRATPLPDEAVANIADAASRRGWVLEVYSAEDFVVDSDEVLASDHAVLLKVPHLRRPLSDLNGAAVRAQLVVPVALAAKARSIAPAGTVATSAESPAMPGVAFVSITKVGTTKAAGLRRVAVELGIDMARTAMIGDGHNDVDAMRVSGVGIAMGNADEAAKAAANHVVGHVDEGGLAEALALSAEL